MLLSGVATAAARPRRARSRCSVRTACATIPPPPSSPELASLLQVANEVAHRAARLCVHVQKDSFSSEKSDRSPVSVADFSVQALVSLALGTSFPHIPLVAEEDSTELRRSPELLRRVVSAVQLFHQEPPPTEAQVLGAVDRGASAPALGAPEPALRWVLDPVDGTVGFLRGGDAQYAVGLALVNARGEALLGVLALPNWVLAPCSTEHRGCVLVASRGRGTWYRALGAGEKEPWRSARVQGTVGDLQDATVSLSDHETWASLPLARAAGEELPAGLLPLCCGSLVKYAAVSLGLASLFVQHPVEGVHRLKAWDHAAGVACLLQAGGCVSDFAGAPVCLGSGSLFVPGGLGLVACATTMHPRALQLVQPSREPLLVLLDRDGVLNVDRGTWVIDRRDLEVMPGSAAAIAQLNQAGHTVAVVTNQSCINRGLLSWEGLGAIHAEMSEQLHKHSEARVDAIFVAPDDPDAGAVSAMRKPGPGMLQAAMARFGISAPQRCVMVGDTAADMRAAAAAGVSRRFLVCTGHGAKMGDAAAEAGVQLPIVVAAGSPLAGLLPADAVPLELHADLASVVRTLLMKSKV